MIFQNSSDPFERQAIETFQKEFPAQRSGLQAIKAGKSTAADHQTSIYRRFDIAIEQAPNLLGTQQACKPGCSYCCHYKVHLSASEALAIAEHLHSTPASKKEACLNRLQANVAEVRKLGPELHMTTNIQCAFLSEDGQCEIYSLRPIACRRHHSYDVTPCKVTFDDPSRTDPNQQSLEQLAIAAGFTHASHAASEQTGFDNALYEMNGAILEAVTNGASSKRWKNGKNAFPTVGDRKSLE